MMNLLRMRILVFLLEHSNTWVSCNETEDYIGVVELNEIMKQIAKDGFTDVRSVYGITFFRYKDPNHLEMNFFIF
jgi:hypothetical protein